jgi:hypothetical protein
MSVFSKYQTERDAQNVTAVALDRLQNPDDWWNVLMQRLASSEATRLSGYAIETAA